jgi:ribosomal protein L21E
MAQKKKKKIREKGKIRFSEYFKKLEEGQKVAVVREKSVKKSFPDRIIGKSGIVSGSKGSYKVIQLKDGNKTKEFLIHPINLKALK